MPAELNVYDGVIFDPPRAGARLQAEQLAISKVPVIIGVSCNPVTFAPRRGDHTRRRLRPDAGDAG